MNTSVAAAKPGVDQLALIGRTSAGFRQSIAAGLNLMGLPEYYFPEPNGPCSADTALEVDNELLHHVASFDMIRIGDVPREFLTASRIILSTSLREISELPMWLTSSSHSSIIWDLGIQRVDSNGGTRTGLSNEQMREMLEFVEAVKLNQQEPQLLTAQSDPRVGAELLVE